MAATLQLAVVRHALVSVATVAVLAYAGFCVLLFFMQAGMVYYPERCVELTPADLGLDYESVTYPTADGGYIAGWYVANGAAKYTILYFHGNAGNIGDRVPIVGALHGMGFNVFIIDYRGYGNSSGKPSERGTYADATAAWEYLTKRRGLAPETIVVYGRSLGGAVACELATRVRPAALVLESTFTSVPDMGARQYPFLPVRLFCRIGYDTAGRIGAVACPVLIAHSRNDGMIPFEHGRRLFDKAPDPKVFHELAGDHNDSSLDDPASAYGRVFLEFVAGLKP